MFTYEITSWNGGNLGTGKSDVASIEKSIELVEGLSEFNEELMGEKAPEAFGENFFYVNEFNVEFKKVS